MNLLAVFVEPAAAWIFALAQLFGGNLGAAVIVVSVSARLLMLPLTLRLAERSLAHRKAMEAIRPELDKLRRRFRNRPQRLAREAAALLEERGVQAFDTGGLVGGLVQAPVFITLWTAVRQVAHSGGRFLWIADLARPDVILTALAAVLAGAGTVAGIDSEQASRAWLFLIPAVLSLCFLWKASAGVGLYWASSSAVGLLQGHLLRRRKG